MEKDQLLDAVHWIRQAVRLACGLLWGTAPLVGAFWIALCRRPAPPTTPNLEQGVCTVLEDDISDAGKKERLEAGLHMCAGISRWRSAQVIVPSYVAGFVQERDHAVVSFVWEKLLSGVLAKTFLMMLDYNCGLRWLGE